MNRVKFDPDKLQGDDKTWWDAWVTEAEQAKQKSLEEYDKGTRPVPFKGDVWSKLKAFLLKKVFHGKCAYCDSRFIGNSFGDAEHFRPKGKVTRKKEGKDEVVMVNGEEHPGYYWLAYDWRNLIPACQRCNSDDGKMNQFPVKNGTYVTSRDAGPDPKKLDELEEPLLLHPYDENLNPDDHIIYGDKGVISARSVHGQEDPYGAAIIATCNLKRGELESDRAESQEAAWSAFLLSMPGGPPAVTNVLAPYRAGVKAHSRAALQYVEIKLNEIKLASSAVGNADAGPEQP